MQSKKSVSKQVSSYSRFSLFIPAKVLEAKKDKLRKLEEYEKKLCESPDKTFYLLALDLFEEGKFDKAKEFSEAALKINPNIFNGVKINVTNCQDINQMSQLNDLIHQALIFTRDPMTDDNKHQWGRYYKSEAMKKFKNNRLFSGLKLWDEALRWDKTILDGEDQNLVALPFRIKLCINTRSDYKQSLQVCYDRGKDYVISKIRTPCNEGGIISYKDEEILMGSYDEEFYSRNLNDIFDLLMYIMLLNCLNLMKWYIDMYHSTLIKKDSFISVIILYGNIEIIRHLVEKGILLNVGGIISSLSLAVLRGDADIVRYLIQQGAKVDCHHEVRLLSPLIHAGLVKNVEIVRLLLSCGDLLTCSYLDSVFENNWHSRKIMDSVFFIIQTQEKFQEIEKDPGQALEVENILKIMKLSDLAEYYKAKGQLQFSAGKKLSALKFYEEALSFDASILGKEILECFTTVFDLVGISVTDIQDSDVKSWILTFLNIDYVLLNPIEIDDTRSQLILANFSNVESYNQFNDYLRRVEYMKTMPSRFDIIYTMTKTCPELLTSDLIYKKFIIRLEQSEFSFQTIPETNIPSNKFKQDESPGSISNRIDDTDKMDKKYSKISSLKDIVVRISISGLFGALGYTYLLTSFLSNTNGKNNSKESEGQGYLPELCGFDLTLFFKIISRLYFEAYKSPNIRSNQGFLENRSRDMMTTEIPLLNALIAVLLFDHNIALQQLVKNGYDLNVVDEKGRTPLMLLTAIGSIIGVKQLLKSGANADLKNSRGITVLMVAAHHGRDKIVNHLLNEYHVQVNIRDQQGWSALMHAASFGGFIQSCMDLSSTSIDTLIKVKESVIRKLISLHALVTPEDLDLLSSESRSFLEMIQKSDSLTEGDCKVLLESVLEARKEYLDRSSDGTCALM